MEEILKIEVSPELARALQAVGGTLDRAAKETLAVSLFREGRLSHFELSKILKLDRFETDAVLKRHEVVNSGLTLQDLEMDRATLDKILGPAPK